MSRKLLDEYSVVVVFDGFRAAMDFEILLSADERYFFGLTISDFGVPMFPLILILDVLANFLLRWVSHGSVLL